MPKDTQHSTSNESPNFQITPDHEQGAEGEGDGYKKQASAHCMYCVRLGTLGRKSCDANWETAQGFKAGPTKLKGVRAYPRHVYCYYC